MSATTTNPAVLAFADAQRKFVKATISHAAAFTMSATACALALRERGVTLQRLADANRELTSDIVAAPKGTLFTSVEGVAYHGLTGDILLLPFDEDGDDVDVLAVQSLVIKVKRDNRYGVKAIKACIRRATSQQECIGWLRDALKAPVEAETVETVESGEETGEDVAETVERSDADKLVTVLTSALAIVSGNPDAMTDAARAIIAQLSGPVALPVAV